MPALPFKLNQAHRHHIPKRKRKVVNWRDYDANLRQRGSLTVWFTAEAIEGWRAAPRTTAGGQPWYSPLAMLSQAASYLARVEAARDAAAKPRARAIASAGKVGGPAAVRDGDQIARREHVAIVELGLEVGIDVVRELALQLDALEAAGVPRANIVEEKESGVRQRPAFDALLKELKTGDSLVAWKVDRLGRDAVAALTVARDLDRLGRCGS